MSRGFTLGVICARSGSKGLPDKNILPLMRKPLIAYTIDAARHSKLLAHTIVSTDSQRIGQIAERHGGDVPFLRDPRLATDKASNYEVLRDAVQWWETHKGPVSAAVLLQPTSPLRNSDDIDAALKLFWREGADAVVSVKASSPPPYWMVRISGRGTPRPVIRRHRQFVTPRQMLPGTFVVNGAIYVLKRSFLMNKGVPFQDGKTRCLEMPGERSVDIDYLDDFIQAEQIMKRKGHLRAPPATPHPRG